MKRLALAALICAALAQPALADPLAGYEPVDLSDYQPREAASAVMLLQDLFEGHPETVAEGRSVLKIDLRHNEDRSALLIDLEMTGYLDDSVDAEKYRAIVVEGTKHTFRLDRLGKKTKCGRGSNAGQWTTGNCP
jgi:hypothetical protein